MVNSKKQTKSNKYANGNNMGIMTKISEADENGSESKTNLDELNSGFGDYLRSSEGVEMMKLFVFANTILVFVTVAWPNIKESLHIIRDYFLKKEN